MIPVCNVSGYLLNADIILYEDIYPPTDRMSCLTCRYFRCLLASRFSHGFVDWWGLEIVMPHKSVAYLGVSPALD